MKWSSALRTRGLSTTCFQASPQRGCEWRFRLSLWRDSAAESWLASIYWDQASVLVQLGKLDPAGLPIAGVEVARKALDRTLPSNQLMAREWGTSEGKPI